MRIQIFISLTALAMAGCSKPSASGTATNGNGAKLPLVAFAQANSADPWRQVFDREIKAAANEHSEDFIFEEQAAEDDANKQIGQIETLMLRSPKVLLISPTTEAVQKAVEKVYDSGVPVILLDRAIPGDKFTCLIAGDNLEIGKQAADFISQKLKGHGTVLMIQGLGGASATTDRRGGAVNEFAKFPGIQVIQGDDCKYQRQAAQSFVESFLQSRKSVDAIYAHNDEMAIGAYLAWSHSAGKGQRPLIVGVDGCQKEVIDYIRKGQIDATFKYPIPGPTAIAVATDLIKGKKAPKKIVLRTELITRSNADKYLSENPSLAR